MSSFIPTRNTTRRGLQLTLACAALAAALPASAYVGPGAGLSLVGALWAVVAAVGAALFFILAWPIRRMIRRRKLAVAEAPAQRAQPAQPTRAGQ